MTLEEIAKLAGVSRSTVSRVVNDHPNVKQEVRDRVWAVIRENNYYPNNAARALVSRRTQIIGLVIPQAIQEIFSDPYFPILIQGISAACDRRGYYLMLSLISEQMSNAYRRIIKGGHLDGVIVASAFCDDDSFINQLVDDHFPFVLIGRQPDHPNISSIDADNSQGAAMAVQHLARQGYSRIATITGPLSMTAAVDRQEGFLTGLRRAGLELPDGYVVEGDFTEGSGYRGMEQLLSRDPRPGAVFAASDMMAVGALRAARAHGVGVPQEIAIVGFDDLPLAAAVEPAITTIRQPIEQLGNTATTILLDMLDAIDDPLPLQRVVLPTELVVRDSCGYRWHFGRSRSEDPTG